MIKINSGGKVVWIEEKDEEREGIEDNEWVEIYK